MKTDELEARISALEKRNAILESDLTESEKMRHILRQELDRHKEIEIDKEALDEAIQEIADLKRLNSHLQNQLNAEVTARQRVTTDALDNNRELKSKLDCYLQTIEIIVDRLINRGSHGRE